MATKTPISILQEYCVSKNLPIPRYDYENRTQISSPSVFACYCFCDGRRLEAVSSSKKDAKQRVAEMMLSELKVPVFATLPSLKPASEAGTTTTSGAVNYIGLLNEYCSGHGLPYPEYSENGFQGGYFFCVCRHGSLKADGAGKTKKEAKRCAAQNMLEEINKNGFGESKKSTPPASTIPNYDVDQVINKYKNLSINPSIKKSSSAFKDLMMNPATAMPDYFSSVVPKGSQPMKPSPVDDLPKQHIPNVPLASHASLAELESKLKGRGVEYEVEKTQDAPIVLIYSEQSSSNVSLEIGQPGDCYESVLRALLGKVVQQYELLES